MQPSWEELLETLRCPVTGGRLRSTGDGYVVTEDGERRYPIIEGAPILLDESRSLFDIADVVGERSPSRDAGPAAQSRPGPRERLLELVKRVVPNNARNVGADDRYRRLAELVRARGRETGRRPRVLFVGAQIAGAGTDRVIERDDIASVETDVDTGPRTQVVCDAHQLPFADGTFDAVVTQAVLELVADPYRVAEEVHRVLRPRGLVCSEISFMQQVHGGVYDFTRFTLLGHRRLWRWFDELEAGAQCGPAMALAWSLQYFAVSFVRGRVLASLVKRAMQVATSWLTLLDPFLARRPGGVDAAAGTYFIGARRETPVPDRELVHSYKGLARWGLKPEAETSPGIQAPPKPARSSHPPEMATRRPKLVVAITLAGVGGAQAYVAALLPALVESFEVIVAAHGSGPLREAAERRGARFVELRWMRRSIGPADLLGLVELVRLLRRERPAAVQLNSSKVGLLGRVAAFIARVPVRVFTVHGWAFNAHSGLSGRLYLLAERLVRPLTTLFICPAEHEKRTGVRARTCSEGQAVVIPNAVDVSLFTVAGLGGRPPVVVSVGRLHPPKDFLTLARALAMLRPDSFSAQLIGDGPDRAAIEAELAAGGLTESVEITGLRDDVPALLASADLFVLSSLSECMPISILEAMSSGLPTVATNVGGVPEIVAEGETGLLVSPADPAGLGRAIGRLVEDPGLRRRMGSAARSRAAERFDLPAFGKAHVELLSKEIDAT